MKSELPYGAHCGGFKGQYNVLLLTQAALTIGLSWKGEKHLSASSISVTFHSRIHGNDILAKFTYRLLFEKAL